MSNKTAPNPHTPSQNTPSRTGAPSDSSPIQHPKGTASIVFWSIAVVVALLALYAVLQVDNWGDSGNNLPTRFGLDTAKLAAVDPALVNYAETQQYPIAMQSVRGIASLPDGGFVVAGDKTIQRFSRDGEPTESISCADEPICVTVAGDDHVMAGHLFVGFVARIDVFDTQGQLTRTIDDGFDPQTQITSLAVLEDYIYAADAGNRVIARFAADGKRLGSIGKADPSRKIPPFIVPSAHFDIVGSDDGILRAVNPGARRIQAFTLDGDLLGSWGKASAGIEGFFGCCNPAALALLPDGRFVTAEKGIPRVKVYAADGTFESVVATTDMLSANASSSIDIRDDHRADVLDVATDPNGRVLVLDPNTRAVRIFELKTEMVSTDES
ncbi:hypothetical protein CA13_11980 [Planctomycetes bacterium CA13]|uniref:NHL repeat protein n=1 Tax=Novipirellula herctigrandis TaxID=2527986 RepID=A0A5C5YZ03_9BACT|nr:hypothetical protein CA13_11980 [Planctomycetes bacterium CA13]